MKSSPAITIQNLSIGYRTGHNDVKTIHRHLNATLHAGELTCLLGANGAGKSTLLRTLSGAQPALDGTVSIGNTPIKEIPRHHLSRQIGMVLTDKTAVGGLTVREVVALGRQPHTGFFGTLSAHDREVVDNSIAACGITGKAGDFMASLSDGERQKVMIAKALAQECPIVLLDEPTAFLDVVSRIEIMSLLHNLATRHHRAILLSTHDIEQALVLGDRLWLLSRETGLRAGATEDLIMSGMLDNLFPHTDIHFDTQHGSYYPTVHHRRTIAVSCSNDTLLHWTINLLNRNGYHADLSTEASASIPHLHIDNATHITLCHNGQQHTFATFDALSCHLQSNL